MAALGVAELPVSGELARPAMKDLTAPTRRQIVDTSG